jgi:hypothetical protein
MSIDDSRAQWTTHNNLDKWFDNAKHHKVGFGDFLKIN